MSARGPGGFSSAGPWSLDARRLDWRLLPRRIRQRLAQLLYTLCQDPGAVVSERVTATPCVFRVRVDKWRVLYRLDRAHHTVIIEDLGAREDDEGQGDHR